MRSAHLVIPAKAGIHWLLSNKIQNGFPLARERQNE
jgi:hypothetical protein